MNSYILKNTKPEVVFVLVLICKIFQFPKMWELSQNLEIIVPVYRSPELPPHIYILMGIWYNAKGIDAGELK